jgi:muramoyltetrapeptide carboxypeptidase
MKTLKPPRLRKGDVIGIVSPASTPSAQEKVDKGVRYLEGLGYRVKIGRHVMAQYGYLAGTDKERATDLNDMLRDPAVRAVFALRGGYGTPRILDLVDYRAARRDPKILVGYSDITGLQLALLRKAGLVTFSGPMVAVEMWDNIDPFTEENFWRVITSASRVGGLQNPDDEPLRAHNKGRASGILVGGNFSLLASLMGTPYLPNLRKTILVLAGVLKNIAGLVLGKFTDCVPGDPSKPHLTIEQVLQEAVAAVGCPVLTNLQYGHIAKKLTIPFGVRATLDTRTGSLNVSEGAVR